MKYLNDLAGASVKMCKKNNNIFVQRYVSLTAAVCSHIAMRLAVSVYCGWTCTDTKWVEAVLSPYVQHYPSAAALCLFTRSRHRFQLHGPQTRTLIPSRFSGSGAATLPFREHLWSPTSAAAKHQQLSKSRHVFTIYEAGDVGLLLSKQDSDAFHRAPTNTKAVVSAVGS